MPFIDALQKQHSRMVGFLKMSAIEGKIAAGQVLVAEETRGQGDGETRGQAEGGASPCPRASLSPCLNERLGYVIGQDRYFKRDDLGIIFQLNVVPGRQRSFVGATLLKAVFDRAAYGCRLFCCWCAQDIEANRFWESMGFVPLAYRAGSEKKARVHIFWQKRIRQGDFETPWWFPAQTNAGAMGADRIVLPIPPGTHWGDPMPVLLPAEPKQIPDGEPAPPTAKPQATRRRPLAASQVPTRVVVSRANSLRVAAPDPPVPDAAKPPRSRGVKPKTKNDPRLVAAARELRDRRLEHVNAGEQLDALVGEGKYDLTRALPAAAPGAAARAAAMLLPAA